MSNYDAAPSLDNTPTEDEPETLIPEKSPLSFLKAPFFELFNREIKVEKQAHKQTPESQTTLEVNTPPVVALEKKMAEERIQRAEEQKQTELRHRQEVELSFEHAEPDPESHDLHIDHEGLDEKVFDRRHEVLDDTAKAKALPKETIVETPFIADSAPTPISQILRSRENPQRLESPSETSQSTPAPIIGGLSAYKKSIRTGFVSGLVIIALGFIVYTIFGR